MTIKQAIEKSVEEGYHPKYIPKFLGKVKVEKVEIKSCIKSPDYLIDPLFWQSLGKAMGWEKKEVARFENQSDYQEGWLYNWHRFIDHLAEGKDAESFFKNL